MTFVKLSEQRHEELKSLICSRDNSNSGGVLQLQSGQGNAFERFRGVIEPLTANRKSSQTSFVNIGRALKDGISEYNSSVHEDSKIITSEFDGSLQSWSYNAYACMENIISRQPLLSSVYGKKTLFAARRLPHIHEKLSKYNREISRALKEVCVAIPVLTIAKGDWAARELLKAKFQNAKSVHQRKLMRETEGRQVQPSRLSVDPPSILPSREQPLSDLENICSTPKRKTSGTLAKEIRKSRSKRPRYSKTDKRTKGLKSKNIQKRTRTVSKKKRTRRVFLSSDEDEIDSSSSLDADA